MLSLFEILFVTMPAVYLTGDKNFWVIFLVILLRYVVLASIAFVIFYVLVKRQTLLKKIQPAFPSGKDYLREIFIPF